MGHRSKHCELGTMFNETLHDLFICELKHEMHSGGLGADYEMHNEISTNLKSKEKAGVSVLWIEKKESCCCCGRTNHTVFFIS